MGSSSSKVSMEDRNNIGNAHSQVDREDRTMAEGRAHSWRPSRNDENQHLPSPLCPAKARLEALARSRGVPT